MTAARDRDGAGRASRTGEAGFSLMEAIAATIIAVVAVLGLAYSFSIGRGFIDTFEVRRIADAKAQGCMEWLGSLPAADPNLADGAHGPQPFQVDGRTVGALAWSVGPVADAPANVQSLLRDVRVTIAWTYGTFPDSVAYVRTVAAP